MHPTTENRYTYDPDPDTRVLTVELPRERMADLLSDLALLAFPPQSYGIILPHGHVRIYLHTPQELAIGVKLLLTDIRDGRVRVDANVIVMADPVRQRINAWLAERARRWPNTANPHLFISSRTAVRTTPVSATWIIDKLSVLPRMIREDRILNEAIASGGDVRRLCDLFGISVITAQRYADVILKPNERDLTGSTDR